MDDNSLRISKVTFRFGSSPTSPPLAVNLKNVTILVGPNNSGKSQTLKDIKLWTLSKHSESRLKLLSSVELDLPSEDSGIEAILTPFQTEPSKSRIGTANRPGQIYVSLPTFESSEPHAIEQIYHLEQFCEGVHKREINTLDNITRLHTMLIDERIRFNLIADSPMGDLLMNPTNPLTYLYLHDTEMEKLSNIIFDEFGLHVYLDSTSDGILRIRVNEKQWQKRRSHDDDALEFMGRSPFLRVQGAGVQSFMAPAYCCY